ncbi:hypothetical protein ASG68_25030 [Rhizobium sp. Leaf453]|nr:hypothetical protein ASG68_25030 [Rhizobium sp. Leaf453]
MIGKHRARLLQNPLGRLRIVARKFVGVQADRLRYISRHHSKTALTVDKRILRGSLEPARKIDDNLLPFRDAGASDAIDIFFHVVSLRTDVESDRAHQAPIVG